jgi:hypothetical protein
LEFILEAPRGFIVTELLLGECEGFPCRGRDCCYCDIEKVKKAAELNKRRGDVAIA